MCFAQKVTYAHCGAAWRPGNLIYNFYIRQMLGCQFSGALNYSALKRDILLSCFLCYNAPIKGAVMKIDRQMGILSILLQRDIVTAPYLTEHFEVSRRTINRDIEDLCKAGIPIATRQGINGGISIMEKYLRSGRRRCRI